jgi:hypothetical protein
MCPVCCFRFHAVLFLSMGHLTVEFYYYYYCCCCCDFLLLIKAKVYEGISQFVCVGD